MNAIIGSALNPVGAGTVVNGQLETLECPMTTSSSRKIPKMGRSTSSHHYENVAEGIEVVEETCEELSNQAHGWIHIDEEIPRTVVDDGLQRSSL